MHVKSGKKAALLKVPRTKQKRAVWCWAACGESIMEYAGTQAPQCEQANKLFNQTACCKSKYKCNHGASAQEISKNFENFYFESTPVAALPLSKIADEVQQDRPLEAGVQFLYLDRYGQPRVKSRHVVVVCGYDTSDKRIVYMDPKYGDYVAIPHGEFTGGTTMNVADAWCEIRRKP